MRTTVNIDEGLLRRVKEEAARTGRTISALIEDAVRVAFAANPGPSEALSPLVTAGGSGVLPGIDLDDLASLRDRMDEGEGLNALR